MNDLTITTAEAVEIVDFLLDDEPDHYWTDKLRKAENRRDLASVAMNIPQDRYGAGSTGARFTLVVLLMHGMQAARDFVKDIEHHEET